MYSNEAMSIVQWAGVTNITCLNDPDTPCLMDGEDVLQKYGFKSSNFWLDILDNIKSHLHWTQGRRSKGRRQSQKEVSASDRILNTVLAEGRHSTGI
ncbi:unnamed protein product, partial [Timema podura]|nr:unnamed protein product [Timema podura]